MTESIKDRIRGATYCALWYLSIMLGFYYLYAPLLPLLIFKRDLYRKTTDILFAAWESFNVSLMEIVFGVRTFVSGDVIRPEENSIIVVNHRTRLDWNFVWAALLHGTSPPAHNAKLVLKDEVKQIPGIGWIMQMCRFLYICRSWKRDEERMGRMLDYLASSHKSNPFQLILFPEGTNLTPATKAKSNKYGAQNNLKPLNNLLHPRTTGFSFIASRMREVGCLDAVYDVTIAYPAEIPETEMDLAHGKIPAQVHFHIKRHAATNVPTTWIGLEKWLQELWRDKDQMLDNFYKEGIRFPATSSRQQCHQPLLSMQFVSLFAWLTFVYSSVTGLFAIISWHWIWVLAVSGFMALVSKYTDGLQDIEIKLERRELMPAIYSSIVSKFTRRRSHQD